MGLVTEIVGVGGVDVVASVRGEPDPPAAATVRLAVRVPDGTLRELAPMTHAAAADAMRRSPGAVRVVSDPRTHSAREITALMNEIRRQARRIAGLPADPSELTGDGGQKVREPVDQSPLLANDVPSDAEAELTPASDAETTIARFAIDWRDLDDHGRGHGVNIVYRLDDSTEVTLAFIAGFEWRRGAARVEVNVQPATAPVWAQLGREAADVRLQMREIVDEILAGASLISKWGRFRVIANA